MKNFENPTFCFIIFFTYLAPMEFKKKLLALRIAKFNFKTREEVRFIFF